MKTILQKFAVTALFYAVVVQCGPARAQQYNSDNYLSKPHGVATLILTVGERNDMYMTTLSLFPKWEFTAAAYLYHETNDRLTENGYSTSYYVKWMLYENKAQTGGVAVKGGTGMDPGYLSSYGVEDAFQTYWMNAPLTMPLFNNKVSWDLMPGASVTRSYGDEAGWAGAFTYSTRLAWYTFGPEASIVGEVFGAEGKAEAIPEYKVGVRWEPSASAVFALTYGDEFDGDNGAGFEFGIMLFTPPFAKF